MILEHVARAILSEAWSTIDQSGDFIDPRDRYWDPDGTRWAPMGGGGYGPASTTATRYTNEAELAEFRQACRDLADHNPFAINGHENRISYTVGTGHVYSVIAAKGRKPSDGLIDSVQAWLDYWLKEQKWAGRQQESMRRWDRDGEVFYRIFADKEGVTRVRFVEPAQVFTPKNHAMDKAATFGVLTEPDDVETVLGYWVDDELIEPDEIQHRKANVDANSKRGMPTMWPVIPNLDRALRLLRNITITSELQTAIGLIRTHKQGTSTSIQSAVRGRADISSTSQTTGKTTDYQRFRPGSILDVSANTDYDFPAAGINPSNFTPGIQAELRAVASRLVMPEFMLTADASNANYSSTMVSEGPAVKNFERLQFRQSEEDLELIRRCMGYAVAAGLLPPESLSEVEIRVDMPDVAARDRDKETVRRAMLLDKGIIAAKTFAAEEGYDHEEERDAGAKPADTLATVATLATPGADATAPTGDTPDVAEPPPAAANQGVDVQGTGLNGAQIDSLMGLVQQLAAKQLPRETVEATIKAAFPLLADGVIQSMLDPLANWQPAVVVPPTKEGETFQERAEAAAKILWPEYP